MTKPIPHAKRPCPPCPWVKDTPPGEFDRCRYDGPLRETTGSDGNEVPIGSPYFACHRSAEGKEIVCAGWLAAAGYTNLGVRMAVRDGRLPGEMLRPKPDWPELFATYDEMADTQARKEESDDRR